MGQSPSSKNYTDNSQDWILIQGNADLKNGKVSPRIYTSQLTKKADIGDIILTVRAPVGEVAITDYNAVLGRGVAAIKGNLFIYFALEKFKANNKWNMYSSGSTFDSITGKDLNNLPLFFPSETEENKIGELLNKLDNLLTLYERKLQLNLKLYAELLKQFIPDKNSKSILNKINWQSISLGKIAHLQKGKQKNRNDISEVRNDKETYPVYNGGKEKSGYTDEYNRNDSIIISEGGNSAGYVNYIAGKFYSGGHNYSIEPQNIDSSLLYLILLRNQSRIMNLRTGSGLPNIKISSLKSFKIFIPSKNDNLYDFDKLLILFTKDNNLIKDKLNKLKLIKKTLLNTMFI